MCPRYERTRHRVVARSGPLKGRVYSLEEWDACTLSEGVQLLINHEEPRTPKGDRDRMTRSRPLDVTAAVRDRVIPAYSALFFLTVLLLRFQRNFSSDGSVQIQP